LNRKGKRLTTYRKKKENKGEKNRKSSLWRNDCVRREMNWKDIWLMRMMKGSLKSGG
jgi:hypothetical protein